MDSLSFGGPNHLLCSDVSSTSTDGIPRRHSHEVPALGDDSPQALEGTQTFEPNGLLEGSLLGGMLFEHMELGRPQEGQEVHRTPDDVFVHTGLLPLNGDVDKEPHPIRGRMISLTGHLASQNDEEFPEVTDILRPYASSSEPTNEASSSASALSLQASSLDGDTVVLKRRARRKGSANTSIVSKDTLLGAESSRGQQYSKLLDVPIHRLLDQLSAETAMKVSRADAEAVASAGPVQATMERDTSLWVDRYRPKRYTDLLGDDRVHREVVSWVKEWDYCVFGRRQTRGYKRTRGEEGENLDEWRRPQEKLLLLSGPPGMGKTTLAHVIAKHSGYSVFEINASDSRSAQVIDERLRPALETGSAIGSSKPILVIIDEIDGATGGSDNSAGFIQKLIQLTYDKPRKKGRKADPKAVRPLLRPILCICNDLYASSLTKLRAHARIVRFSRPNDILLSRRLREICDSEGLRAESRALSALVGVTQGDLRSCLNMLQLIKARGKEVTEPIVRTATAGIKEADASQTSVLNNLFAPMSRKRTKDLGLTEEEESRYVSRLSREIESSGSMDKIAQGCFEHYANCHRHDSNFSRYLKANEWLTLYDLMSGEMRVEREYALMQYLPYMLVGFYPLFQERGGPRVERPKADYENYLITKMNEEIHQSLARGLRSAAPRHSGDYRHLTSDHVLKLELVPYLNRIISPSLKPVNRQIIRPGEKAVLSRLVDIMVALELRFIQEKTEDGQLSYRLDPPIDVFVTYDGKRASDISVSKYAVRQLVATEIDTRLASIQAESNNRIRPRKGDLFKKTAGTRAKGGDAGADAADEEEPAAKRVRHSKGEPTEKIAVDFFGRPIVSPAGVKPKSTVSTKVQQYRVVYRFNEGNSAAVRKPVKVGAFL